MTDDMTNTLRWWINRCRELEADLDIQRALNLQMQQELVDMEEALNRQLSHATNITTHHDRRVDL